MGERLHAKVPRWYRPSLHVGINVVLAGAVLTLLAWELGENDISWAAWLSIPVSLVFANIVEYCIHRFPMHRRTRLLDRFFRGHTLIHHRYFDDEHHDLLCLRDAYFVLTTAHTTALSVLILSGAYVALGAAFGTDVAVFSTATMAVYSIGNELLHLTFHFPDEWTARRFPFGRVFQWLREQHRRHHNPKLMTTYNFNITFPLGDILFRTRLPDPKWKEMPAASMVMMQTQTAEGPAGE